MKIFFPKELDSETRVSITPDFLKKYLDSVHTYTIIDNGNLDKARRIFKAYE